MVNMNRSIHQCRPIKAVLAILAAGLLLSVFPQAQVSKPAESSHDVMLTAIRSDSLVSLDSTLAITVVAENKGRNVVEAIVALVDSVSTDTLENWYPLFPPESSDSIVMFWNTKGVKTGSHTLSAVIVSSPAGNPSVVKLSRTTTVVR
jgi:hypothetical protein